MNLDKAIEELEAGVPEPRSTEMRRASLSDADMARYGLRRKDKNASQHTVWMVATGQLGTQLACFFDHKLNKAMKKALQWKASQSAPQQPASS